jgi:tetratricopeptide (TPR) repeat protein
MPRGRRRLPVRWSMRPLARSTALAALWLALVAAASPEALLRSHRTDEAIAALRAREARSPRDVRVKRELGVALLESGDASGALAKLREARERSPRDRLTLFHLGRAAERAGLPADAVEAYRACASLRGRPLPALEARIRELTQASMRTAVGEALRAERLVPVDSIPSNTVAVPEFALSELPDSLAPLGRGLALVMTTDLSHIPQLRVVERERLNVLSAEIARSEHTVEMPNAPAARGSLVATAAAAQRNGGFLGTRYFAQGGLVGRGADRLQLDAGIVDVRDGHLRPTGAPVAGRIRDVLGLEKLLLLQVLDSLHVRLSPAERSRIATPPTRNFDAFLAFSRGLDFEDRGMVPEASAAYQRAVRLDPGFGWARNRGAVLSVTAADQAALDQAMRAEALQPEGLGDRLLSSGAEVGLRGGPLAHDPATLTEAVRRVASVTISVGVP